MRVLPHMGSFAPAAPEEILRPAKPWFVLLSLVCGLLLNLVPFGQPILTYRPDFLARWVSHVLGIGKVEMLPVERRLGEDWFVAFEWIGEVDTA